MLPWQLSAGFAIAEAAPVAKTDSFARCLQECTEYAVTTCGRGMSSSKLERLCEVSLDMIDKNDVQNLLLMFLR